MVMGTFYPSNDDVTLFKPIERANELDLARQLSAVFDGSNAIF